MTSPESAPDWPDRWNARVAWSATVHLAHSAAIFLLLLFTPASLRPWLQAAWALGAFFSGSALALLLRIGDYEGISDEEVGSLIRRSYWVATGLYLGLLLISVLTLVGTWGRTHA